MSLARDLWCIFRGHKLVRRAPGAWVDIDGQDYEIWQCRCGEYGGTVRVNPRSGE